MTKQITEFTSPNFSLPISAERLGQAVKAKRTQSGLRLEDAAALCGVAKQTFSNIEHGKSTCRLGSVLQICSALGIELVIMPWTKNDDWV